jgi:hypothetical protein
MAPPFRNSVACELPQFDVRASNKQNTFLKNVINQYFQQFPKVKILLMGFPHAFLVREDRLGSASYARRKQFPFSV